MADAAAYEAQRLRQIEENKRKIEELGLRHLADAIPSQANHKQSKHKVRAPGAAAAASVAAPSRRSSRVANLPEQPDYREPSMRFVKKMPGVGATATGRRYAIAKAKELENELGATHPTFVKIMTRNLATAMWMKLPVQFCRNHLPNHDEEMKLVDEEDGEFEIRYHTGWSEYDYYRISWKRFAMDHKLDDGDCLVFQLIQQAKFKEHIWMIYLKK
ncbi:hypothetical protein U9M48_007754 [Paspalum notatum var. saurae]|uniref:TF-B3 domain-containing protein n=1 Tax=Paspalum notatum var. saurae TaxID=547442 RepID=A0AAQ3SMR6_PASNO